MFIVVSRKIMSIDFRAILIILLCFSSAFCEEKKPKEETSPIEKTPDTPKDQPISTSKSPEPSEDKSTDTEKKPIEFGVVDEKQKAEFEALSLRIAELMTKEVEARRENILINAVLETDEYFVCGLESVAKKETLNCGLKLDRSILPEFKPGVFPFTFDKVLQIEKERLHEKGRDFAYVVKVNGKFDISKIENRQDLEELKDTTKNTFQAKYKANVKKIINFNQVSKPVLKGSQLKSLFASGALDFMQMNDKNTQEIKEFTFGKLKDDLTKAEKIAETGIQLNLFEQSHLKEIESQLTFRGMPIQKINPCQPKVLALVGFYDKSLQLRRSTKEDQKFCPLSLFTCCTRDQLIKHRMFFNTKLKSFNLAMEVVNELLISFHGPKLLNMLTNHRTNLHCLNESDLDPNSTNSVLGGNIFSKITQIEISKRIAQILSEFKNYVNEIRHFYGNLICTFCNPNNHDYFGKYVYPMITADLKICEAFITLTAFEINFATLYNDFIIKIARFFRCLKTGSWKTGLGQDEDLEPFSIQLINKYKVAHRQCSKEKVYLSQECTLICAKNLQTYSSKFLDIKKVKTSLKIIYQMVASEKIENFYKLEKNVDFNSVKTNTITFFNVTETDVIKKFYWRFRMNGISPFNDFLGRAFTF